MFKLSNFRKTFRETAHSLVCGRTNLVCWREFWCLLQAEPKATKQELLQKNLICPKGKRSTETMESSSEPNSKTALVHLDWKPLLQDLLHENGLIWICVIALTCCLAAGNLGSISLSIVPVQAPLKSVWFVLEPCLGEEDILHFKGATGKLTRGDLLFFTLHMRKKQKNGDLLWLFAIFLLSTIIPLSNKIHSPIWSCLASVGAAVPKLLLLHSMGAAAAVGSTLGNGDFISLLPGMGLLKAPQDSASYFVSRDFRTSVQS